jgi:hypothetical protein
VHLWNLGFEPAKIIESISSNQNARYDQKVVEEKPVEEVSLWQRSRPIPILRNTKRGTKILHVGVDQTNALFLGAQELRAQLGRFPKIVRIQKSQPGSPGVARAGVASTSWTRTRDLVFLDGVAVALHDFSGRIRRPIVD